MPNWCDTTYVCVGEMEELEALNKILENNKERAESRVENGFGSLWIGNILDEMGYDWHKHSCRGEIVDFSLENGALTIVQSTAWGEQTGFRQCIEDKYPSVKVYFRDEEPGNCYYLTNDETGDIFPDNYVLYGDNIWEYYETLDELADTISQITGKDVKANSADIAIRIKEHNDTCDEEEMIFLYEFERNENY